MTFIQIARGLRILYAQILQRSRLMTDTCLMKVQVSSQTLIGFLRP